MRYRLLAATAILVASFAASVGPVARAAEPGTPSATETTFLVSDPDKLELTVADDGTATVAVTLLNTANSDLSVVAVLAPSGGACRPGQSPQTVAARSEETVKLAFVGCTKATENTAAFYLAAAEKHDEHLFQPEMTATQKVDDAPKIDWGQMQWFLWCGLGGAAVLIASWAAWSLTRTLKMKTGTSGVEEGHPGPLFGLKLGSSWKFSESWASNATVIAAAFTGVFGATDVTKTILGEETAKPIVAIATVATAVALALAGTAPMLLQLWRRWDPENHVTPLGLICGGTLTLAATGGELGVLVTTVNDTDAADGWWALGLPFTDRVLPVLILVLILGLVLLAAYAFAATMQNLVAGEPKEEEKQATQASTVEVVKNWLEWIEHWKKEEPARPTEELVLPTYAPEPSLRRTAIL